MAAADEPQTTGPGQAPRVFVAAIAACSGSGLSVAAVPALAAFDVARPPWPVVLGLAMFALAAVLGLVAWYSHDCWRHAEAGRRHDLERLRLLYALEQQKFGGGTHKVMLPTDPTANVADPRHPVRAP